MLKHLARKLRRAEDDSSQRSLPSCSLHAHQPFPESLIVRSVAEALCLLPRSQSEGKALGALCKRLWTLPGHCCSVSAVAVRDGRDSRCSQAARLSRRRGVQAVEVPQAASGPGLVAKLLFNGCFSGGLISLQVTCAISEMVSVQSKEGVQSLLPSLLPGLLLQLSKALGEEMLFAPLSPWRRHAEDQRQEGNICRSGAGGAGQGGLELLGQARLFVRCPAS